MSAPPVQGRYLLRAGPRGERIDIPTPQSLEQIHALLDVDSVDAVALRHLPGPLHVMLVDDIGQLREPRRPLNVAASTLYAARCGSDTGSAEFCSGLFDIFGDAFICPDDDFGPSDGRCDVGPYGVIVRTAEPRP